MNSSSMSAETNKKEFRKYLERSGAVDAITKVLVALYEEKERPANAVDYIKRYLGAPTGVDTEEIKRENENLRKEVKELKSALGKRMGESKVEEMKVDE